MKNQAIYPLTFILLFFTYYSLSAQTFVGSTTDNRAGVHSLVLNPALVINEEMRADINLFSSSVFVGNDYIGIDLASLTSIGEGFVFDEAYDTNPKEDNNFFGNVDVLGPSFQFNLNPKSSIGFTTRVRAFFNINNIGGELYQVISSENEDNNDFSFVMEDLTGIVHAWGEVGLTYGRVLMEKENQLLKGGVTLKYLAGAGGVFGNSSALDATYSESSDNLTTGGLLNYGYTNGFDSEDISFSDISSGFGADIGFVYELKNTNQAGQYQSDGYKFRFGLSLMDIGGINYAEVEQFEYDMNATVPVSEYQENNLEDVLAENFNGTNEIIESKFGLPTSLQFFGDYSVSDHFFVSLNGAISLASSSSMPVNQIINYVTATPRYEMKWISVYSPVSFREYDSSIMWGLGLRAGPVIVGSGSIFSNILSSSSKSADLFVGFKIPLYSK